MKYFTLNLIKLYKKSISKIWGAVKPNYGCRFYPSCSDYCVQAIQKYGVFKGLFKGFKRILRCNPFNKGGIDIC